jgi:hypothetical protein
MLCQVFTSYDDVGKFDLARTSFQPVLRNQEITAFCFKRTIDLVKWPEPIAVIWRKALYSFLICRKTTATGFYAGLYDSLGKSYCVGWKQYRQQYRFKNACHAAKGKYA